MECDLPRTRVFNYYEPEDPDSSGGQKMEFRLIYQGPLPAERCEDRLTVGAGGYGRATDKHKLRKLFHPQLRELWRQHPDLRKQSVSKYVVSKTPHNMVNYPGPDVEEVVPVTNDSPHPLAKTWVEHLANNYQRCGGRFVPLIREDSGFTCDLEVLFLRRDNPGNLIANGGDIDNRIKVLFDGLRMPKSLSELGDFKIEADEDPFFCLLEDDKLVTKVAVTTDRLIIPQRSDESVHEVLLVIHVTMVNPSAIFAPGLLV